MKDGVAIVLIGMKSSGKTTTGKALAKALNVRFIDMDFELEQEHFTLKNEQLPFREIFKKYGRDYFRSLEVAALAKLHGALRDKSYVLATGGGLPLDEKNQETLKELGTIIFLDIDMESLLPRIISGGIPPFFPYPDNPKKSLSELLEARRPVYMKVADITLECDTESPELLANKIIGGFEGGEDAN
ncbi:MAG: shikimate kinase [Candidatus Electrothrix sp. AR1]|nr:shikimate kinase [Candidatus Electrothrix sp. AR1]